MQPFDVVLSEYATLLDLSVELPEAPLTVPTFQPQLISELLDLSFHLLSTGNALVSLSGPAVVVGDLHGSIIDLVQILRKFPEYQTTTSLLFLGDYVDRGTDSVPVMVLLLALLCKYPTRVVLVRGNHEFSHINQLYGFFDEIMTLYNSDELWTHFQTVFAYMPLAAVIDTKLFCVHGGLSPQLKSLDQISQLQFPINDYFDDSLVADLVWSDPSDSIPDFIENDRGSGVVYGTHAIKNFLAACGLKVIIRAHQCVTEGWTTFADTCGITLFSSSDYCRLQHNRAAVIRVIEDQKLEFICVPQDGKVQRVTMAYGKPLGLKRVVTRSQAEAALRSKLASRFGKKTTMVTPKAQKPGQAPAVKRSLIASDAVDEGVEHVENAIPSK
jgi:diadenosine tetraphosphatase ApaH/serine/threonine PP2A family protein phosphatase